MRRVDEMEESRLTPYAEAEYGMNIKNALRRILLIIHLYN